jgi:hypothetical protein
VARPEERKLLGFSISNDGSGRRIAPKALDKFWGHRFCRYADCNIYVRSRRAGERVMASVSRFLTKKLRLTDFQRVCGRTPRRHGRHVIVLATSLSANSQPNRELNRPNKEPNWPSGWED